MQCTSISVVSAIDDLDYLEDIGKFIEDQAGLICVDMTTKLEERPGCYKDVVVAKDGPILLTKEPLMPGLPECFQNFLNSTVFHAVSAVSMLVCISMFGINLFIPREYREGVFCISTSLLIVIYFLNICMFRSRIFKEVATCFEFYYLAALQAAACGAGAYLYQAIGTNVWAAGILMGLVWLAVTMFGFGIDASPFSKKVKTVYMMISFGTHLLLFMLARFIDSIFTKDIYDAFMNDKIDFVMLKMSPQEVMISALMSLMVFYLKYAALLGVMGQEFIMVWYEAKDAQQEIGEIKKVEEGSGEGGEGEKDLVTETITVAAAGGNDRRFSVNPDLVGSTKAENGRMKVVPSFYKSSFVNRRRASRPVDPGSVVLGNEPNFLVSLGGSTQDGGSQEVSGPSGRPGVTSPSDPVFDFSGSGYFKERKFTNALVVESYNAEEMGRAPSFRPGTKSRGRLGGSTASNPREAKRPAHGENSLEAFPRPQTEGK